MSPPCLFGCEYRWTVASSQFGCKYRLSVASLLFSKTLFWGYRLNVYSPWFLKFGLWIWTGMLRLHDFWNFGCEYQLECCISTIFEILQVSTRCRFLAILKFWKYRMWFASFRFLGFASIDWASLARGFWKTFFLFKDTMVVNFDLKPFGGKSQGGVGWKSLSLYFFFKPWILG